MKYLYYLLQVYFPQTKTVLNAKGMKNTYWLMLDQIVRMVLGFVTLTVIARYYGPDGFGKLNYAIAFVSLFSVLSTLGLEKILVREFIIENKLLSKYIATGFYIKLFGGIVLFIVTTFFTKLIDNSSLSTSILIALLSFITLFQAFDVIDYWYQAHMESKYSVIAKIIPYILATVAKIIVATVYPSLIVLGLVYLIEAILSALGLMLIYKKEKINLFEMPNALITKKLLHESLPLIFSTVFVTIYMKIDQVFLQHLASSEAVGIYSAAVRISEMPFFIGVLLTNAAFPIIIRSKLKSQEEYLHDIQLLFSIVVMLGLLIAVVVTLLSSPLINLIFGKDFGDSVSALRIHIWSIIFVFLGVAQGVWVIGEKFTRISFIATLLGAILNAVLNYIFIPVYGVTAAAISTVVSYALSGYVINFFFTSTREIAKMQTRAFLPTTLLYELRRRNFL